MKTLGQVQSAKQDPLAFAKMAGGGNDFVVIDNRQGRVADAGELTRRICTPHLSVGADGLILIEHSPRATFRMRYFNQDGGLADFCANGTRCAARFAFVNVIAPKRMTIETDAGVVGAEVADGGAVTLSLPPPRAFAAERSLRVGERTIRGSSILVGVPHYVIYVRDGLWSHDVVPLGRAIRTHADLGSAGANVNFVTICDEHAIEVRTYEPDVRARRGGGDAVMRLGRGGVGVDGGAVGEGDVAGGGADAERDHARGVVRAGRRRAERRTAEGRRAADLPRHDDAGDDRRVRSRLRARSQSAEC